MMLGQVRREFRTALGLSGHTDALAVNRTALLDGKGVQPTR
jgi:hypothetical protein